MVAARQALHVCMHVCTHVHHEYTCVQKLTLERHYNSQHWRSLFPEVTEQLCQSSIIQHRNHVTVT